MLKNQDFFQQKRRKRLKFDPGKNFDFRNQNHILSCLPKTNRRRSFCLFPITCQQVLLSLILNIADIASMEDIRSKIFRLFSKDDSIIHKVLHQNEIQSNICGKNAITRIDNIVWSRTIHERCKRCQKIRRNSGGFNCNMEAPVSALRRKLLRTTTHAVVALQLQTLSNRIRA